MKFGTQPTTLADIHPDKDPERQLPMSGLELESIQPENESSREPPVITPPTARPHDDPDVAATSPTDTEPKSAIIEDSKASESSPGSIHLLPDKRTHDAGEGPSSEISPKASDRGRRDDVVPDSIGREICPICIVDFEEGDDIRLLPCEGKHSFHQQCVDPWLLKLSSSCPICRHGELLCEKHTFQSISNVLSTDFLALENMLAGHSDTEEADEFPPTRLSTGRFSQYLRFANLRQSRRRREDNDPTDPYMPTAPETSMYSGM